jgi:hypothetical protein
VGGKIAAVTSEMRNVMSESISMLTSAMNAPAQSERQLVMGIINSNKAFKKFIEKKEQRGALIAHFSIASNCDLFRSQIVVDDQVELVKEIVGDV